MPRGYRGKRCGRGDPHRRQFDRSHTRNRARQGARVLRTPKRGLGRAYIDAIPFVRGKFIIMGDADCTYDFRQIAPFIEAFRNGSDFVMGSRFKGSIEDNAMPALHRYFGTPLTTWILNRMFASRFSDIHCGMRGISVDALLRMDLRSQGWEYASEMVLKSVHMELPTTEVPIHFLKDPDGRLSHMKRRGWMEPWRAGWRNLQAMFVYGFDFFLIWPGFLLLALGLIIMLPLLAGPMSIAGVRFSSNAMLLPWPWPSLVNQCWFRPRSVGLSSTIRDACSLVSSGFCLITQRSGERSWPYLQAFYWRFRSSIPMSGMDTCCLRLASKRTGPSSGSGLSRQRSRSLFQGS